MHALQLPLALPHTPSYRREDFVVGPSNAAALRLMESWPDWPAPIVLLSGPAGSGKTHLVHIWARQSGAAIFESDALFGIRAVAELGHRAALALEDIRPEAVPEAALFHLINAIREAGGSLLLTSEQRVEDWRIALADLRSRLRMAAPAVLGAPEDDLLRQVLVKLFADRQLEVERPVVDYLVARMERSLGAAVGLVEALDRQALAAGRPITRPVAAAVLAEHSGEGEFAERQ